MKRQKIQLPFLIWTVILSTFVACVGGTSFLGYNISGIAWVIPLFFSLLALVSVRRRIRFPIGIWGPWGALVIVYLSVAEAPHALQRSIMILCPIIVGMAVSKLRIDASLLLGFDRTLRLLAVGLWVVVALKTGIYLTGKLPDITGLAAEVMTSSLLGTYFVASHVLVRRRDIAWWAGMTIIPVVAMTRTGIAISGLSYPATFAPLRQSRRVALLLVIAMMGFALFNTERVQQKMFFSGHGSIADLSLSNPDFRTTGRSTMWNAMTPEIEKKPLLGYGTNATEPLVSALTGGLVHPHNDYLRFLYDYGYIGTFIFICCLLAQLWHALVQARRSSGTEKSLFYAGASSFLVFILFMFTDNIVLYAAFFGNLQFTMLGLAYAAQARAKRLGS